MERKNFSLPTLAFGVSSVVGILPLSAQLPSMSEKENLGYFVIVRSKSCLFRIASDVDTTIKVLDDKGSTLNHKLTLHLNFNVTETLPNGEKINRKIITKSLETNDLATEKPQDVRFRGKATGNIEFEITVSEDRNTILLGGRLLNQAALKNPTQFSVEVKIPDSLPDVKADATKKEIKELEAQTRGDKVHFFWTDGQKVRIAANEPVEGTSKTVSGPGITVANIDFSAYKTRKIHLTASPHSSLMVSNPSLRPLVQGFSLIWTADTVRDLEGKAHLAIEIR